MAITRDICMIMALKRVSDLYFNDDWLFTLSFSTCGIWDDRQSVTFQFNFLVDAVFWTIRGNIVKPQEIGTSFVTIVTSTLRKDNLKLSNSSCSWQWTNWSCQVIPILSSFLQVFFSHFWLCIFLPKNCQLYWLGNKVVPSIHNGSPSITRTCWHR